MPSNERLAVAFQQLHTDIVGCNAETIANFLHSRFVLVRSDMETLPTVTGPNSSKVNWLLNRIEKHPKGFIELLEALKSESTFDWLVEKINKLCVDVESPVVTPGNFLSTLTGHSSM